MKPKLLLSTGIIALAAALAWGDKNDKTVAPTPEKPLIQIALLLDTSGSMSGMINQAKTQLWAIVNEFISAKQDGVTPRLQVALYRYGSPNLGEENGYIEQLMPLTEDLDGVSDHLFKLTTNGGDEYCGWVIRTAVNELQWSQSSKDYKAIFIAGNEAFNQGSVDYTKSCKDAIAQGIIVNTIHCSGGSDAHWKDGSMLADGHFLRIATDAIVVEVDTPFDSKLAELNNDLNATYIAYGAQGRARKYLQTTQDMNAGSLSRANLAGRTKTKASAMYNNADWDMVDAAKEGHLELESIPENSLPKEMQGMNSEERKAYVATKTTERKKLQKEIITLSKKRDDFLADKQKALSANDDTLGEQVKSAVREQTIKKGFSY